MGPVGVLGRGTVSTIVAGKPIGRATVRFGGLDDPAQVRAGRRPSLTLSIVVGRGLTRARFTPQKRSFVAP